MEQLKNKDVFSSYRVFFEVEARQQVPESTWYRLKEEFLAAKVNPQAAEEWFTLRAKIYRLSRKMSPNKKSQALAAYTQALVSNDTVQALELAQYIESKWGVTATEKQMRNCFNRNRSSLRMNAIYRIAEIAEEIFLIVGMSPRKKEKQIHVN